MDSGINGVASVLCYDWLGGRQLPVRVSKMLTVFLGFVVIGFAIAAPRLGNNVINIVNLIAGTMLGALMPMFLLGMFSRRANSAGVLIGLASSAICLALVLAATHIPESSYSQIGLGGLAASRPWLFLKGIPFWWYGAVVIFPSLIVGWAASRFFSPPSAAALAGTFRAVTGKPA